MIYLYEILRVRRDAPVETIRAAYRALAKTHHPDAGGDQEKWQSIKLAHDVLCDEAARAHYDKTGEAKPPAPDNSHAPLMGLLAGMFDAVMAECAKGNHEPQRIDFVASMKAALNARRGSIVTNRAQTESGIAKLEKLQNRFKRKDGSRNFMDEIISGRIALGRNYLASSEIETRRIDGALAYLEGLEFEAETMGAFFASNASTSASGF